MVPPGWDFVPDCAPFVVMVDPIAPPNFWLGFVPHLPSRARVGW